MTVLEEFNPHDALFHAHPDPMWIYDTETLAFLDVNDAAQRKYGWSRSEFLAMTLADIRPPSEVERLKVQLAAVADVIDSSGVWRHLTRDGQEIHVDIVSHLVTHHGRPARLVSARDLTRLVQMERERTRVLESISDGFFTLDKRDQFTFLNGRAAEYLGRDPADLLGKAVWSAFPEAKGTLFEAGLRAAASSRRTQELTERLEPIGRWYRSTIYPSEAGATVYFRDVTDERAAQTRLRLLDQAVSRLNDVVLITEAEPIDRSEGGPKVVYVNDAFVRMTGYANEEIIGQTPRLLQGPATSRSELDRIRRALERWEPVRAELVNYTRSGDPFWVDMDIVPIADDRGWYTHWVSVQRDVTERRRAEEAARVSEDRFRLLARATNDVVWDWDVEGDALWWNDNLKSLFGHEPRPEQNTIDFWVNHIHPEDRERVHQGFVQTIASTETIWRAEYRFARSDGRYAIVTDRGFIIRDPSGRATRALGSMLDVTERRELEESVRQSQKLDAVGQLTGGVAHDFNNLLTVIVQNSEGLLDGVGDNPQLRELALMNLQAAERGAELINRLLAVARRQPLSPRMLNLSVLLDDLLPFLQRTLSKDIEIELEAPEGLWSVEADAGQVEVALLNLAINASDAMPGGGRLLISLSNLAANDCPASLGRPCVRLAVTDTGQAMPQDVVDRAFEPFFTTKPVGKGSGLGLSMVYGFIRQSGGEAQIRSSPGRGSTIELFFPSIGRQETPAPVVVREPPVASGGDEHIMLVEDDPALRVNLVGQLRALGYGVTAAQDAAEALALMPEDVDLLFTDVVMPGGMNGQELAARAAALRPALKVLFTSGYSRDALLKAGRLPKGVHLLPKPYRRRDLALAVRRVLDET